MAYKKGENLPKLIPSITAFRGIKSVAPPILKICNRWMWVVNYMPRQVYPIVRKQCVNSTAAWLGPTGELVSINQ